MRRLLILAALLAPAPAFAHAGGEHVHGLVTGFLHPLGGLDHLLAMVAVGLWAGLLGGRAAWQLPAGFLGGMALGSVLGMTEVGLPSVEAGILASVIVLGALVSAAVRVPLGLAMALVAGFGLLHGHAHGAELLMGQGALGYAAGFLLATAALHALGVLAALRLADRRVVRVAGGAMAALMLAVSLG